MAENSTKKTSCKCKIQKKTKITIDFKIILLMNIKNKFY